jgi:hypothetical protein
MKKGYRIISNGEHYKIQRFYSFLGGILTVKKTYDGFYLIYSDAEKETNRIKTERENIKRNRKLTREKESGPWNVLKIFFD